MSFTRDVTMRGNRVKGCPSVPVLRLPIRLKNFQNKKLINSLLEIHGIISV